MVNHSNADFCPNSLCWWILRSLSFFFGPGQDPAPLSCRFSALRRALCFSAIWNITPRRWRSIGNKSMHIFHSYFKLFSRIKKDTQIPLKMKCTWLFHVPRHDNDSTCKHDVQILVYSFVLVPCEVYKINNYWITGNYKNKQSVLFLALLSTPNKSFWLQLPNALPWRWFSSMWNSNVVRKASSCSHGFSNPCIRILKWLFWVFPPPNARFESHAEQVLM